MFSKLLDLDCTNLLKGFTIHVKEYDYSVILSYYQAKRLAIQKKGRKVEKTRIPLD